jgi:hypothetical protein
MKRILLPVGIISILFILSYADWGMESDGYTDWGVPIEIRSSNTSYRADSLWNKGAYQYGDNFLRKDVEDTFSILLGNLLGSSTDPVDTAWIHKLTVSGNAVLGSGGNDTVDMSGSSLVKFPPGDIVFNVVRPDANHAGNLGKPSYYYLDGYFDRMLIDSSLKVVSNGDTVKIDSNQIYIKKNKGNPDTTIYIKKYGATTNDRYLVFDVDTSNNTAANVIGIDFSGSNAFNNSSDYWIYCDANNWWTSNGSFRASQYYIGTGNYKTYLAYSQLALLYNTNFVFCFDPTYKGDFIFRDGNYPSGTINNDFFQIQDSSSAIIFQISNRGAIGMFDSTLSGDSAFIYYGGGNKFHIALDSSSNASANPDTLLVHGVLKASKGIVGAGGVGGSGTANRIAMWTDASTLGNSNIYQNSSDNRIGIGPVNFSNNPELLVVGGKIGIQAGSIYIGSAGSNDGMSFNLFNIGIGYNALRSISTTSNSNYNIGIGSNALYYCNNGGNNNVGIGAYALGNLTNGSYNVGIGQFAGYYKRTDNSTNPKKSIFIGRYTRSYDDTDSNEIVIGDSAIGKGSNTVVLGNDNIKETYLKGAIVGSNNLAGKIIFSNQSRVAYYLAGVDSSDVVTLTLENRNENDAGMAVINGYCKTDSIIVTAWTMNTLGTWSLKSITGAVQYVIIRR